MADRSIPQRELRNNVGQILREAEAGTEFTITVHGRPVARLGPADRPRARNVDVDLDTVHAILAETPVDDRFGADLAEIRRHEEPAGDPWQGS
jgi:prevent-host-death family protein